MKVILPSIFLHLISILRLTTCDLQFYSYLCVNCNNVRNAIPLSYNEIQPLNTVLITTSSVVHYDIWNTSTSSFTGTFSNVAMSVPFQVKSLPSNYLYNQSSFLVLNTTKILLYSPGFGATPLVLYSAPSLVAIINSCFGQSATQAIILVKDSTGSSAVYRLLYFSSNNLVNSTNLTVSTQYQFDKMIYKNKVVHTCFQTRIISWAANSTLNKLNQISYANISVDYVDIAVSNSYFAYSFNDSVYLLSSSYQLLWYHKFSQLVPSIAFANCYLVITTTAYLYQLDIQILQFISQTLLVNRLIYLTHYYQNFDKLILHQKQGSTLLPLYTITNKYSSINTSCKLNYWYSSGYCIRVCPIDNGTIYIINWTNSTNYTNTANTTSSENSTNNSNAITNTANTSNTTINITPTPTPNSDVADANADAPEDYYDSLLSTPALKKATDVFGKTMVVASMKITPNFLLSFTCFLDDLWYYKYHRHQYPKSVQFFMHEINIINELRLSPWFLDFLSFIDSNYVYPDRNALYHQQMNLTRSDPEDVYFLYAAELTYRNGIIINAILLILLKFFLILTTQLYKRIRIFVFLKPVVNALKYNSRWWLLLVAILESNMMKLTFNCFLQLYFTSFFTFSDTFNFVITLLFLFSLIFYSICFYPIVFSFEPRRSSMVLLIKSRYSLPSFYLQCLGAIFRNFVRAFIHAYFIQKFSFQIILLTLADIVFLIVPIKLFSCFKRPFVGFLSIVYAIAFISFDLYFCIKQNLQDTAIHNLDPQLVSLVIISIIGGSALLTSLSMLGFNIYQIIRYLWKKYKNILSQEANIKQSENDGLKKAQNSQKIRNTKQIKIKMMIFNSGKISLKCPQNSPKKNKKSVKYDKSNSNGKRLNLIVNMSNIENMGKNEVKKYIQNTTKFDQKVQFSNKSFQKIKDMDRYKVLVKMKNK